MAIGHDNSFRQQKAHEAAMILFTQFLDRHGHRHTPERFAILKEIFMHDAHFTMDTLYSWMQEKKYHISRATLYNTMQLLLDANLVLKHSIEHNRATFEKVIPGKHHDHFVCLESGNTIEFSDPKIDKIINEVCKKFNFVPQYHSLYIYGEQK